MAAINRAQISDLDDIMITHRYKSLETSPNDSGNAWVVSYWWIESPSKALCVSGRHPQMDYIPKWQLKANIYIYL
jgi:hypothetical protein